MRTTISADEFAQRRAKATDAARERGLKGLMVCARGGGSVDRYGDVMYLSNFYTAFPFIPDRQPDWSARAHAFVLLPVDGPAALRQTSKIADDLMFDTCIGACHRDGQPLAITVGAPTICIGLATVLA